MHARRQLRRTNSGLSNMSTGTQRDKVFGLFDATTWGLPGTGLMNAAKNAAEDALAPPAERPGLSQIWRLVDAACCDLSQCGCDWAA